MIRTKWQFVVLFSIIVLMILGVYMAYIQLSFQIVSSKIISVAPSSYNSPSKSYTWFAFGPSKKPLKTKVDLLPSRLQTTVSKQETAFAEQTYQLCKHIPQAPSGYSWPEEAALYESPLENIRDAADPLTSKVWLNTQTTVQLGSSIRVNIQLYDGHGQPRKIGGDLVRVWMKEKSKLASTAGYVTDFNNGSYVAIVTAFWVGIPEVVVAIVVRREVSNAVFRRRYICPPVMNVLAVYEHLKDKAITEKTPCNVVPDIPDYDGICNLTHENYGMPWYCGKPREKRLGCLDWNKVSRYEQYNSPREMQLFTDAEQSFIFSKDKVAVLPSRIHLNVTQNSRDVLKVQTNRQCNTLNSTLTWSPQHSKGYVYNDKWINPNCMGPEGEEYLKECLQNTQITLVGDSTIRQMVLDIEKRVKCDWITEEFGMNKHRPASCVDSNTNYSLHYHMHALPFNTGMEPRQYFRPFSVILDEIPSDINSIVILKINSHFNGFHSHVAFDAFNEMKQGIVRFLKRNQNAHVVIEGPNAYSFSKTVDTLWKIDTYADVYIDFINHVFKDMHDKVIYLNGLDITVSTEQNFIHAEDYVIHELVDQIFHRVCEY